MIFFKFSLLSLTNVIRQRPRTLFYFRLFSSAVSLVFSEISASNVGHALSYLQNTHGFSWPRKILKLVAKKIIWSKCPLSLKKKKKNLHTSLLPLPSALLSLSISFSFLWNTTCSKGQKAGVKGRMQKSQEQSAVFSVHLAEFKERLPQHSGWPLLYLISHWALRQQFLLGFFLKIFLQNWRGARECRNGRLQSTKDSLKMKRGESDETTHRGACTGPKETLWNIFFFRSGEKWEVT